MFQSTFSLSGPCHWFITYDLSSLPLRTLSQSAFLFTETLKPFKYLPHLPRYKVSITLFCVKKS